MKKKYLYYAILIMLPMFLSCKETVVQNQPIEEKGILFINSNPVGAQIFLQGTNTGKITPDSIVNLKPDRYELKLNYNGIDTLLFTEVKAGLKTTVFVDFSTQLGTLYINSNPPGALIYINNNPTFKVTPDSISNLVAGNYYVSVISCIDTLSVIIILKRGELKPVNFNFFSHIPASNVSFSQHIYPIFNVKCNNSGCHNDESRAGGVSLTSWSNATDPNIVVKGDPSTSKLVWSIDRLPGAKWMPPNGYPGLTEEQRIGIKTWITEGALNN